jgi:putative hemolysin
MQNVTLEIVVIFLLVILHGVFSMSELAMMTARKARLQSLASKQSAGAAAALALKDNPGKFLSTD